MGQKILITSYLHYKVFYTVIMETLRLVALFSVLATVCSKTLLERATIDVLTSSDGTRFERASTNAEWCSTYSILMTEDGTDWRWPLVTDKGDCHGGMKKNFTEWLDFAVEHKHISGMQNICFEGWKYTMSANEGSEEVSTVKPECTYDDYGKFYEAAHNNVMTEVVKYVEEHNCCPNVASLPVNCNVKSI